MQVTDGGAGVTEPQITTFFLKAAIFLILCFMLTVWSAGDRQMKFSRVVSAAWGVVASQSLKTLCNGTVRLESGSL